MTGRRIRSLLLLAAAAAIGYWIYTDRPTVQGIIDSITNPLMGSRAAVKSSERNRVTGEASSAIAEQSDTPSATSLREGMSTTEVREVLGNPDRIEKSREAGVEHMRWTYDKMGRALLFQDGRVTSIVVLR